MLPRNHPDRIQITFDDRRLVANAGLLLPATLAISACPNSSSNASPGRSGAGEHGRQDDDAGGLRAGWGRLVTTPRTGGTACTLGGTVKAPSALGTFLRSFGATSVNSTG